MDHEHEITLIRGVLVLSLALILISTVFKLGMALGWQAAADDLQWQMREARRTSGKENPAD